MQLSASIFPLDPATAMATPPTVTGASTAAPAPSLFGELLLAQSGEIAGPFSNAPLCLHSGPAPVPSDRAATISNAAVLGNAVAGWLSPAQANLAPPIPVPAGSEVLGSGDLASTESTSATAAKVESMGGSFFGIMPTSFMRGGCGRVPLDQNASNDEATGRNPSPAPVSAGQVCAAPVAPVELSSTASAATDFLSAKSAGGADTTASRCASKAPARCTSMGDGKNPSSTGVTVSRAKAGREAQGGLAASDLSSPTLTDLLPVGPQPANPETAAAISDHASVFQCDPTVTTAVAGGPVCMEKKRPQAGSVALAAAGFAPVTPWAQTVLAEQNASATAATRPTLDQAPLLASLPALNSLRAPLVTSGVAAPSPAGMPLIGTTGEAAVPVGADLATPSAPRDYSTVASPRLAAAAPASRDFSASSLTLGDVAAPLVSDAVRSNETTVSPPRIASVLTDVSRVLTPPLAAAANSAAVVGAATNSGRIEANCGEKKILSTNAQVDAESTIGLGTNVAKTKVSMPATLNPHSPAAESGATRSVSVPQTFEALVRETSQLDAPEPVQTAQQAVDRVLTVTDRVASGDHRAVELQFKISGVDLAVHVALRGDTIHTTFRTDSPELRSALAQEWQTVNAQPAARAQRLAEPVFTASSSGSQTALQADTGGTPQRDAGARPEAPQPFNALRPTSAEASSTAPTVAATPLADSTRLLHAFA